LWRDPLSDKSIQFMVHKRRKSDNDLPKPWQRLPKRIRMWNSPPTTLVTGWHLFGKQKQNGQT
jgi:hypothetical protein